jgi:site-specific DNA recombinase
VPPRVSASGVYWKQVRTAPTRTTDAPALRLVSEELWTAAHARIARTKRAYLRGPGGALWGRPEAGLESKYLLSGFSQCGVCSGAFFLRRAGPRYANYVCTYHKLRGPHVCPNTLTMPMVEANRAVLDALRRDVLAPEVVERALAKTLRLATASPETSRADREAIEGELRPLEAELGRLADLVARGEAFPSIASAIQERERRRAALRSRLAHLDGLAAMARRLDPETLLADLRGRLTAWQALLEQEPVIARQILRKLLVGRIVFMPRPDAPTPHYEFTGEVAYGRLFSGLVLVKEMVPPG